MLFGILHVNAAHNVVHLITGAVALLAAYKGRWASQLFFQVFGITYGLAILGFIAGDRLVMGIANNLVHAWFHLIVAAVSLYLGFSMKLVHRHATTSTSLPSGLRQLIEAADEALRIDPFRTVLPIDRHNIYQMLGLLDDPIARRRRVALDGASARHVISVWEEVFSWDDGDPTSPAALLARAERVLDGEPFDPAIYTEALETCELTGFGVAIVGRDVVAQEGAADAVRAAIATLRTAGGQDPFMALPIDKSTRDSGIDEEDADAARWAASAMSAEIGGRDIRASLEFWEWWLWEAVPFAWGVTPSLSDWDRVCGQSRTACHLERWSRSVECMEERAPS